MLDHLRAIAKQTRRIPDALRIPELPETLQGIWDVFIQIHRRRAGNGFGAVPISWSEIDAWQRLHQVQLSVWEVDCLAAMDDVAIRYSVKEK